MPIGIVYNAVANTEEGWVVVSGIADIKLKDNTAGTRGYWVFASSEAGYADATLANPPAGGVTELTQHMNEIGHCILTVGAGGAGTHASSRCILHFN
jgi:hypothetical protein